MFPANFLWGAATSSHQVEGDNFFNDWWEWETSGNTEPSGKACDHYNRFLEDLHMARELGHNAHRISLEWSRIEKTEGTWDWNEWEHYQNVIDSILKLGMQPIVTLNHFTVPLWFARKGGWLNDASGGLFARFAVKALDELGDRAQYWITLNEPNILAFMGYHTGQWPPCLKNPDDALHALRNMLKGHAAAYRLMHEYAGKVHRIKRPKIGIAKAVSAFHPCSPYSVLDRLSAHFRNTVHNHSFVRSAIKGRVLLPRSRHEALEAKNTLDFIGLNYYFRQFIRHSGAFIKNPAGEVCSEEHHKTPGGITDMGWEIYPRGLYEVIKSLSVYRLPLIITENGLATKDDTVRQRFIKEHLAQVSRAIRHGCPVTGYLHWSLLDNFEWAEGYSKRFGLIEVDFKTQKRTVRDSAKYYAAVIKSRKT
ncbi:MAG: glycoside hydrolase family 1 protein [Candidatus Omnitrophota bacterium]